MCLKLTLELSDCSCTCQLMSFLLVLSFLRALDMLNAYLRAMATFRPSLIRKVYLDADLAGILHPKVVDRLMLNMSGIA